MQSRDRPSSKRTKNTGVSRLTAGGRILKCFQKKGSPGGSASLEMTGSRDLLASAVQQKCTDLEISLHASNQKPELGETNVMGTPHWLPGIARCLHSIAECKAGCGPCQSGTTPSRAADSLPPHCSGGQGAPRGASSRPNTMSRLGEFEYEQDGNGASKSGTLQRSSLGCQAVSSSSSFLILDALRIVRFQPLSQIHPARDVERGQNVTFRPWLGA